MTNRIVRWLFTIKDGRQIRLNNAISVAIEPIRTEFFLLKNNFDIKLKDVEKRIDEIDRNFKSNSLSLIRNEENISKSTQIKYHEIEANMNNLRVDLENMVKEATKPKKRTVKKTEEDAPTS